MSKHLINKNNNNTFNDNHYTCFKYDTNKELDNSKFSLPIKEKQDSQKNEDYEEDYYEEDYYEGNNDDDDDDSKYFELVDKDTFFKYHNQFNKEIDERERYYENIIKKLEEHEEREIALSKKKEGTL